MEQNIEFINRCTRIWKCDLSQNQINGKKDEKKINNARTGG